MTDEDRDLLHELKLLGQALGPFALGLMENRVSRKDHLAFGTRLVNIAARINDRALMTHNSVTKNWTSDSLLSAGSHGAA